MPQTAEPLYLFDFDHTLYAYDFRKRLPALAELGGSTEYHLAKTWWVAGYELRAENGEWPTAEEYLDQFAEVTGARLTLSEWTKARRASSTAIPGSIAALAAAAECGRVAVLSNNPSVFAAALPELAPDVVGIVGENVLVSACLGVRKPQALAFESALEHYRTRPADAFFVDDNRANVEGSERVGISGCWFQGDTDDLRRRVEAFAER
ncbi:HAD-IA family hydrolase [Naasia lichenicola]|uniref:HAD family phosphatase n=1 Tax=Naasia lichenicola TaxID=2565933 RepID=A0A4V3WTD4_9MICO|nr:HAD-IA family hydrolase [Naasia lichenicola]THG31497.1 HAD family phosphatase [Naasia lichenicola]